MEYRLLIGNQFIDNGASYRIDEVVEIGNNGVVRGVDESRNQTKLFRLSQVLETLVADEEIELELR